MPFVRAFDTEALLYPVPRRLEIGLFHAGEPHLIAGPAEPALATREHLDGVEQVFAREIGPEDVGEVELGVGRLDEEEIAEALLAARADHEVDVRKGGGGKVA